MRRWRSGITTTIVLTVVVAVVLGVSLQHVVSSGLVYLGLARQQTFDSQNPRLARQLPGRIAALVDVVQASPDETRPAILRAAQRPLLQVRLLDAPLPNLINQREPEIDLLRTRIQAMLSTPRPVVVAHPPNRPGQVSAGGEDHHDNRVLIEAALSDGRWLVFISRMHDDCCINIENANGDHNAIPCNGGIGEMMRLVWRPELERLAVLGFADISSDAVCRCNVGIANSRPQFNVGSSRLGLTKPQECQLIDNLHHRVPKIRETDIQRNLHKRVLNNGHREIRSLSCKFVVQTTAAVHAVSVLAV